MMCVDASREHTALVGITASRISEYKAKRLAVKRGDQAISAAAVNRPLALLRHLLRLASEEWEVLAAVPKIRLEKEDQGRLRWLKTEEATNLLTKCRESRNPDLAVLTTAPSATSGTTRAHEAELQTTKGLR